MDAQNTITLILALRAGICLFCATALLARRLNRLPLHPLGLLFLCQGISELPVLLEAMSTNGPAIETLRALEVGLIIPNLISPFLLWLYVWELTREDEAQRIPKRWRHYLPLGVAICLVPLVFFIPAELLNSTINFPGTLTAQARVGVLAFVALDVFMTGLVIVYLAAVIQRLRRHKTRLKDIFASTEDRELQWVWLVIVFSVLYLLFDLTDVIEMLGDVALLQGWPTQVELLQESALLGLIWVIGLWGLRQKPIYAELFTAANEERRPDQKPKYDRSALTTAHAQKIAEKLQRAMQTDHLYRDPNLSLLDLSKHIATQSHYVSQTLNTRMGVTFFDYVNKLRIEDAKAKLKSSEKTVLTITYDVGFNSRSSFYTAFRRETGQTPTEFRKSNSN